MWWEGEGGEGRKKKERKKDSIHGWKEKMRKKIKTNTKVERGGKKRLYGQTKTKSFFKKKKKKGGMAWAISCGYRTVSRNTHRVSPRWGA